MSIIEGANIRSVKKRNKALLLRLITLNGPLSRVELARLSGLSKMAVGNQVKELAEQGWIAELAADANGIANGGANGSVKAVTGGGANGGAKSGTGSANGGANVDTDDDPGIGRPRIMLGLSPDSPCVCGMLIKRGYCQIILSDIRGDVFDKRTWENPSDFGSDMLYETLLDGFLEAAARTKRRILAVGVSCIGPIDSHNGTILNPPDYHDIKNLPIVEMLERDTGVKAFIINDANAGALAEKMYGRCRLLDHFVYLHIMNGVGAGLIMDGKLYNGLSGQSGEIGHTSINNAGPKCGCGNTGCLDLYASVDNLRKHARELAPFYPGSALNASSAPEWIDFIDAANAGDALSVSALDKFCGYIAHALINVLNMLDVSSLVTGYDSRGDGDIVERLLYGKIAGSVIYAGYRDVEIRRSAFGGDAPLIGSVAHVADKLFNLELDI